MIVTLKNLHEATAQQVFTQVATHLLTQKSRSTVYTPDNGETCAYRNGNGLMCAAGCLIADDEYEPGMDNINANWAGLQLHGYVKTQKHSNLISDLQYIHDRVKNTKEWKRELTKLAKLRELTMPEIN
jgi:hypothetical protein